MTNTNQVDCISSCGECGHEIFNRGGIILHRKDMYSGKLCMDCNCITPRMEN